MTKNYYDHCSFCGYHVSRVDYLIVAEGVSICNHCAYTAVELYENNKEKEKMENIARQEFFNFYGSDI